MPAWGERNGLRSPTGLFPQVAGVRERDVRRADGRLAQEARALGVYGEHEAGGEAGQEDVANHGVVPEASADRHHPPDRPEATAPVARAASGTGTMGRMATESAADDDALSLELVARIQGGDASAWERLYRRYHDPLLLAIRARLGSRLRARLESEDVLQSVVKDALDDLARFEPRGPGSLRHYLHVCVLNKIRAKAEHFGAAKRDGGVALTDSVAGGIPAPDDEPLAYLDGERYGRLEQALAALPEDAREVVILRTIEGLTNSEAARALGKSDEAASKAYNRALARLGSLVEP